MVYIAPNTVKDSSHAAAQDTVELLAPAGDWDCARAAVENGADAVYFGLQDGLNARARATNFRVEELPEFLAFLHQHAVRGYLTLNTLVFANELPAAEAVARRAIAAGVDAVLVQDLGLAGLLRRLCPDLPLHASTQMTLGSAECIAEVERLGIRRVVLPRELSIEQIAAVHRSSNVELEVFVHGALCMSYSGQCLASLALGGRSANRGQCAQPCRLPYDIIANGRMLDDAKKYPLSPGDLAAYDRLPQLLAAGVSALKIEGRLKPPEYVATATHHYRKALDAALAANPSDAKNTPLSSQEIAELETTFSRGFCHGWLDGRRPHALVSGESSAKRGSPLGEVRGVRGQCILVALSAPVQCGDGVVFATEAGRAGEQGGRVFEIFQNRRSIKKAERGTVELAFRHDAIDFQKIKIGQKTWKTDDPRAERRIQQAYASGKLQRRVPLDINVEAEVGKPLAIVAAAANGGSARLQSPEPLPEAKKHPITTELLTEQLGRLGGTPYELRRLDARLDGHAMIPLSELGKLRHEMIRQLDLAAAAPPARTVLADSALDAERAENFSNILLSPQEKETSAARDTLDVLCHSLEQLRAAVAAGAASVTADFRRLSDLDEAVRAAHTAGVKIRVATPRIHKPGESGVFQTLLACKPDAVLVRNLAALAFFRETGLSMTADFSLNAANDLSVARLCSLGVRRVTTAYDLDAAGLIELASQVPSSLLEAVIYGYTPLFHSEHCLFCRLFSKGNDRDTCGHPCETQCVQVRDRKGVTHLLTSDSQCRNTVFRAKADDRIDVVPRLRAVGIRHFRIELSPTSREEEVARLIAACT